MADTKIVDECCGESEGERGERGKRGHKGHRGPTGPAGAASSTIGPTGPAGTTGATGPAGPIGQAFDYTATGFETSNFLVTIPGGPRADANYIALVTGGAGANTLTTYATDTYTAANFMLHMGIAPALNDVIHIVIVEKP
jgi:hypothetical protein